MHYTLFLSTYDCRTMNMYIQLVEYIFKLFKKVKFYNITKYNVLMYIISSYMLIYDCKKIVYQTLHLITDML